MNKEGTEIAAWLKTLGIPRVGDDGRKRGSLQRHHVHSECSRHLVQDGQSSFHVSALRSQHGGFPPRNILPCRVILGFIGLLVQFSRKRRFVFGLGLGVVFFEEIADRLLDFLRPRGVRHGRFVFGEQDAADAKRQCSEE